MTATREEMIIVPVAPETETVILPRSVGRDIQMLTDTAIVVGVGRANVPEMTAVLLTGGVMNGDVVVGLRIVQWLIVMVMPHSKVRRRKMGMITGDVSRGRGMVVWARRRMISNMNGGEDDDDVSGGSMTGIGGMKESIRMMTRIFIESAGVAVVREHRRSRTERRKIPFVIHSGSIGTENLMDGEAGGVIALGIQSGMCTKGTLAVEERNND